MLSCKKGTRGGVKIWVSVHLSLVLKPFGHIFAQLPEMGWDLTSQQRFQTSWNLRKNVRNLAVNVKKTFHTNKTEILQYPSFHQAFI